MKNIWIIDHYSSEPQYGGYTRQYNFAKELSKSGFNVTVIVSSFSHFSHSYITEKKVMINHISENVRFIYNRTSSYHSNSSYKRFFGMVQFYKVIMRNCHNGEVAFGKPDYVIASSPHPFVWVAAEKIAKKFGGAFIAEVRDFWPLELKGVDDDFIHRTFYKLLEKLEDRAFEKACRIICTLPYGGRYICKKGFNPDKVCWIGHPLDCKKFDALATSRVQELPKEIAKFMEGKFVCVFTGYYMPYEGVYQMLEAAKETKSYNDIVYVFCGSGNEEKQMREYVKCNDLNNVLIYNRIDKSLIPALLCQSDICLAYLVDDTGNQAFQYGLSKNKLNEYLYSGKITVMGYDYLDNEVSKSKSGFVFNTTTNQFARYIKEVYEMSEVARVTMGCNGKRYIYETHDISVLTQKYVKLLQSIECDANMVE